MTWAWDTNIGYAHPTMVSSWLQRRVSAVSRMVYILKTEKSDLSKKRKEPITKNGKRRTLERKTVSDPHYNGTIHILWEGLVTNSEVLKGPTMSLRFKVIEKDWNQNITVLNRVKLLCTCVHLLLFEEHV